MGVEAAFTLVVVLATVALLATERVAPPFVLLAAVTVLLVTGVVGADEALSGFSNPAPITVAALYVLARAAEVSGLLEPVTRSMLGSRERGERSRLMRLVAPSAGASAFLNNTPLVALASRQVVAWAARTGHSPAPYLMPISFAAICGGLVTVIGTSTNVVVSGLLRSEGLPPLGFFEIGWVGVPVAVLGVGMLVVLAPRLLPDRRAPSEDMAGGGREFFVEMQVAGGGLGGRTVAEAGLRSLEGVYLVEIERDGHLIAPVGPEEVLADDDRLVFAGNVSRVLDLQRMPGLVSASERHFTVGGSRFFEAVIAPGSALVGSTLKEAGFRGRYGGAVVAVHRSGERLGGKLGEVHLRAGDVLLVLAAPGFATRWRDRGDFLVVSSLEAEVPPRRNKRMVVGLIALAFIASVTFGLIGVLEGALLAAAAVVLSGGLTPGEAREAVDLNVVVVIAASFGVGAAVDTSGLAGWVAQGLVGVFEALGPVGVLAGVLLTTIVLTELITNNAAAVLMFPIALASAAEAGLDPRGFAIAVAVGASASFLTPIGYQTNTMVYGMGGYRFADFARLGAPLTLLMVAVTLMVVPLVWPLAG